MLNIPPKPARRYTALLERNGIAAAQRSHFKKGLRYYLNFCHKYAFDPTDRRSFPAFDDKLRTKHQSEGLRKQAFRAVCLYDEIMGFDRNLEKAFGTVEGVVRAKKKRDVPVVLSREEVDRVISHLSYPYELVSKLLYGSGLRLFECLKLRVQDFNFELQVVTVHDRKGKKDRIVPLPQVLMPELNAQLGRVIAVHQADLKASYAGAFLPTY